MSVDTEGYMKPQPTLFSNVQLSYEPSPELNHALRQFIQPTHRIRRELSMIALHSESIMQAPLDDRYEHPPAIAAQLEQYRRRIDSISPDYQHRLASVMQMIEAPNYDLAIYLELLPDVQVKRKLGRLACRNRGDNPNAISVVAHIPSQHRAVGYDLDNARAELRQLLAADHPTRSKVAHLTPAPQVHHLWVQHAVVHDRPPLRIAE